MKDMTLCVVCVILGMFLATMFKQVCGCKNIEGFGLASIGDISVGGGLAPLAPLPPRQPNVIDKNSGQVLWSPEIARRAAKR